jgi:hypothetical protein
MKFKINKLNKKITELDIKEAENALDTKFPKEYSDFL